MRQMRCIVLHEMLLHALQEVHMNLDNLRKTKIVINGLQKEVDLNKTYNVFLISTYFYSLKLDLRQQTQTPQCYHEHFVSL